MVWLRNRELSPNAELSSPLIISPEYVRGSYKWLQDHENKIENSYQGSRGLEFYELFSVDGARKGTQPKLCAPWFQHYTTDDLCSVPIHTMAADFKQQYKQLPCVVSYLQKEVRCNSTHPDLGCVCGTASCFAPNLWLEGIDKPGREKLSVAHAMLDVSIINNKRGIFERRYLYLPVARCYEFIGNKLHFETNLDLGPQDKPLLVFLPKSDGSGWVTQELARWRYQRTQYGIYEHMARHLKRMGLDLFPAVLDAAAAPGPAAAAAAAAATAPPAAATATGEAGGRKAAHGDKPSAAVAGRAVSTSRAAARAAAAAGDRAQEATPASKSARLSMASSPTARAAAAAAAAGPGGSRPKHKGPVASAASAGGSRPLRSRALLSGAVPEAGVIAAATGEANKPESPTPHLAPPAAAVLAAVAAAARDAAPPSSQVHAQAAPAPAAPAAAAAVAAAASKPEPAAAVVSAENTTMPVECAAGCAAAAAVVTAAASWISNSGWPAKQPAGPTAKIQTQPTDTTSSESGVLTCAADAAAAATMARQMASSSEPTDCWAALSAMLQPTLAAQETIFSSAQHKRHQDHVLAEGGRMVCT